MEGKNTGAENNLWRGGLLSDKQRIRSSMKYKQWVKACLIRDDYTCVFCSIKGVKFHVDHIIPFAMVMRKLRFKHGTDDIYNKAMVYDELWDLSNGRTLCVPCHKSTDTYLKPNL
jgi:5-methylcytosine-specific restriction endonuclease McrA